MKSFILVVLFLSFATASAGIVGELESGASRGGGYYKNVNIGKSFGKNLFLMGGFGNYGSSNFFYGVTGKMLTPMSDNVSLSNSIGLTHNTYKKYSFANEKIKFSTGVDYSPQVKIWDTLSSSIYLNLELDHAITKLKQSQDWSKKDARIVFGVRITN
jgi:hypothetical protein